MLTTAILAEIALMMLVPMVVMTIARRRLGTTWALLGVGVLTFVAAQAVRWPFLWLLSKALAGILPLQGLVAWAPVLNLTLLSVTSGLFEEGARYLGYRFVVPRARRWEDGVTCGLGHGGSEAIILSSFVVSTFVAMLSLKGATLASLPPGLDPLAKAAAIHQAQIYWSTPVYLPLLGGLERLFAMCFHVAMALLVLRAVVNGRLGWLLLAMAVHAGLNGTAVLASRTLGAVPTEAALAVVAMTCLWMSLRVRPR